MTLLINELLLPLYKALLGRATAQYRSRPDSRSVVKLARALLRSGKPNEAYSTITAGRRAYPDSEIVKRTYELIRMRYAKALLAKAMHTLKHDRRIENFIRAADLLRTLGQTEKALAIIEQVRREKPKDWALAFAVGQIYFNRFRDAHHPADLTESLNHLRLARRLNPDSYKVLFFMALTCAHAAHYEEALECLDAILNTQPNDLRALGLRTQVGRARAAQALREGSRSAARDGDSPPDTSDEALRAAEPSNRIAERLAEIPEVLGAFIFSELRELVAVHTRENEFFDFTKCQQSVLKMIDGCKVDAGHIGIGQLQSCVLAGEDWQVLIRACEDISVVVFIEGDQTTPALDSILDQLTAKAH